MKPEFRPLVLLLTVLVAISCAQRKVRGEPPYVGVDELHLATSGSRIEFVMRNLNDEPLVVQRIVYELSYEGRTVLADDASPDLVLVASGAETFDLPLATGDEVRALLADVERGAIGSLPYRLEGAVWDGDGKRLPFHHRGHLYPVPGRDGHFRATGESLDHRRRVRPPDERYERR